MEKDLAIKLIQNFVQSFEPSNFIFEENEYGGFLITNLKGEPKYSVILYNGEGFIKKPKYFKSYYQVCKYTVYANEIGKINADLISYKITV